MGGGLAVQFEEIRYHLFFKARGAIVTKNCCLKYVESEIVFPDVRGTCADVTFYLPGE